MTAVGFPLLKEPIVLLLKVILQQSSRMLL